MSDPLTTYGRMLEMRYLEEAIGRGCEAGEVAGEMHLAIGQEAIAAGIEPLLRDGDAVVSTHRPHLHALIAGVDPRTLMSEIWGRVGGLSDGKGGHMHLFDPAHDFMCTGIVGASIPLALGYALARKQAGRGEVAVAVMGDGAMNHGTFSESANLAALWKLPIVVVCEDNGFAISVATTTASAGELHTRGESYGLPGVACDGTDPAAVRDAGEWAFRRAREGEGPALVVATAYRFRGHYEGDPDHYRSRSEREEALATRDPLTRARNLLVEQGHAEEQLDRLAGEAQQRVSEWVAHAQAQPKPDPDTALTGVFV